MNSQWSCWRDIAGDDLSEAAVGSAELSPDGGVPIWVQGGLVWVIVRSPDARSC